MNAKLIVVIGNTTKREVELHLPSVLGRSREADVTVAHPLISRRHCEISENDGLLMLRDLASLNGTMIGGRRIELAPLLPDAEFTIGPLTFRVLYEYDGDLESVPDTRYADELEEPIEAALGDPIAAPAEEVPMVEADEALPAEPVGANESGEFVMADLMAMADVDPDEIPLAAPASPTPTPPAAPIWPPVANDKLPTVPMSAGPRSEPLEVDSSLQSGGHRQESPGRWRPRPWKNRGARRHRPPRFRRKIAAKPAAQEKPPAKRKRPQPKNPPKKPTDSGEMDSAFGSYLEDLQ